jgi:hypothetical protein
VIKVEQAFYRTLVRTSYHLPPTKSSRHGVSVEQMFEIVVAGG